MSINKMNAIFKEAYKEFLETGKMPEPTPEQLAEVEVAAEKLLSNPVIENFTVRVEK